MAGAGDAELEAGTRVPGTAPTLHLLHPRESHLTWAPRGNTGHTHHVLETTSAPQNNPLGRGQMTLMWTGRRKLGGACELAGLPVSSAPAPSSQRELRYPAAENLPTHSKSKMQSPPSRPF